MPVVADPATDLRTLTARLAALGTGQKPLLLHLATPTETGWGQYQVALAVVYGKLTVTYWNDHRSACWRVERYELGRDAVWLDVSRRAGADRGRLMIATAGDTADDTPFLVTAPTRAQWQQSIRNWLCRRLPPGTHLRTLPRQHLTDDAAVGWWATQGRARWLVVATLATEAAKLRRLLGYALAVADADPQPTPIWLVVPPQGGSRLAPLLAQLETARLTLYEATSDWAAVQAVAGGHQVPLVMQPLRRWTQQLPTPDELEHLRTWFGADLDAHCEVIPVGQQMLSVRWYGVECARWCRRSATDPCGHRPLWFGLTTLGEPRRMLTDHTRAAFQERLTALRRHRTPAARDPAHPLYRAYPERWLDAIVRRRLEVIDDSLEPAHVWSQAPQFGGHTTGLADFLALTRCGQLAVVEIKAHADADLIWQGLTYWQPALHHWRQGDFVRRGYFAGAQLDVAAPPRLYLVAPMLRIHRVTRAVARRLRSDVPLTLVGVNERWRQGLRVVLREHFGDGHGCTERAW